MSSWVIRAILRTDIFLNGVEILLYVKTSLWVLAEEGLYCCIECMCCSLFGATFFRMALFILLLSIFFLILPLIIMT